MGHPRTLVTWRVLRPVVALATSLTLLAASAAANAATSETTVDVGGYPTDLLLSPDGKELFVANLQGGLKLHVIDTATGEHVRGLTSMRNARDLEWHPTTGDLWAGNGDRVWVMDPVTGALLGEFNVDAAGEDLTISPDGKYFFWGGQAG